MKNILKLLSLVVAGVLLLSPTSVEAKTSSMMCGDACAADCSNQQEVCDAFGSNCRPYLCLPCIGCYGDPGQGWDTHIACALA